MSGQNTQKPMTDAEANNKKPTFAEFEILRRVAQKEAMSQKPAGFQDYTEHTDYTAYGDYVDAHGYYGDEIGCEFYDDACVEVPKAPDHETGITPAKPSFLQRIFGKHR